MPDHRKRVRIVSDGTAQGTRVLDSKGDAIPGITKIEIDPILPNNLVVARITFIMPLLDIDAEINAEGTA